MQQSSGAPRNRRSRRNPARYLALLSLAAVLAAIYLVAHKTLDTTSTHGAVSVQAHTPTTRSHHGSSSTTTTKQAGPAFYVVRSGDSLSEIASRAGLSLASIEALNPHLNAADLQPGDRVRLR